MTESAKKIEQATETLIACIEQAYRDAPDYPKSTSPMLFTMSEYFTSKIRLAAKAASDYLNNRERENHDSRNSKRSVSSRKAKRSRSERSSSADDGPGGAPA